MWQKGLLLLAIVVAFAGCASLNGSGESTPVGDEHRIDDVEIHNSDAGARTVDIRIQDATNDTVVNETVQIRSGESKTYPEVIPENETYTIRVRSGGNSSVFRFSDTAYGSTGLYVTVGASGIEGQYYEH
ncbi:hypothetical protein [Halorientalis halophila]|uniref:hypothetical protein n=1 Tax=Halorientalis halophila TaxID=3108499 RepID=UPI00300BDC92